MSDLINSIMHVNPSGQSFVEAVFAGLVDMLFEVILVVLALGALLKRREQKTWARTRQGLAYVLMGGMERTTKYCRALIYNKDGRIVLNADIQIHLHRLRLSLSSFNEQVIVHLLSLLPPLSEKLSELTYTIARLEESALELDHYLNHLDKHCPVYAPKAPDSGWVNPSNFKEDKQGNLHLSDSSNRSNDNYFVLAMVQIFNRITEVHSSMEYILSKYADGWRGFAKEDVARIKEREAIVAHWLASVGSDIATLKANGLYMVLYKPTPLEIEKY